MLCELFMDECYWLCGGKPAGNDGRSGGSCICPVGVWGLENISTALITGFTLGC